MHRMAAKFVTSLMIDDQKANRFRVCQGLVDRSDELQFVASSGYFRLFILQSDRRAKLFA